MKFVISVLELHAPGSHHVGVKNITALGNLIRWQKVSYDFKYHQQDFDADIPVLTLSEARSLLPVRIMVNENGRFPNTKTSVALP